VLDKGEVHEGEEWPTEEIVEVEAECMGSQFGLHTGTEPTDRLGAVPLEGELFDQLA
jgi:hypothetical protein